MKCIVDSSSWSATAEETIQIFFSIGDTIFTSSIVFGDGTAILRARGHLSDAKV